MNLKCKWLAIAGCWLGAACDHPVIGLSPGHGIVASNHMTSEKSVAEIKLPKGFQRIHAPAKSFHAYLKTIELKDDRTVYLYNGRQKQNQSAQYVVLNISVGKKDLQQCADAVMRIRAEYFYKEGRFQSIEFFNGRKERINYANWLAEKQNSREAFMKYMEYVFSPPLKTL